MLRQGAWPPASCWVAEWVSCGLQGQHALHTNYNCRLNRSRTEGPRGNNISGACTVCRKMLFVMRVVSERKIEGKNTKCCFRPLLSVHVGGRSSSRRTSGATAAAAQQQPLCVSDMSPKMRTSVADHSHSHSPWKLPPYLTTLDTS